MRELTVRIKFTTPSLGNVPQAGKSGRMVMPRNQSGAVMFLATWHNGNMRFAAKVLGKHQDEVDKILWDVAVDSSPHPDRWLKRYYTVKDKQRYVIHETFVPGQIVGINCVVPNAITDEDLWRLMNLTGQYKGLSPARPFEFGKFEVVSIRPRRAPSEGEGEQEQKPVKAETRTTLSA